MPRILLPHFILCALLCFGCSKPPSESGPATPSAPEAADSGAAQSVQATAPQPTSTQSEAPGQLPVPSTPAPPHVAARAQNALQVSVVGEVDPSLTSELRIFVQKHDRLPESFAEFATRRLDSIPRPPPGKVWAIDVQNLQVKAVRSQ